MRRNQEIRIKHPVRTQGLHSTHRLPDIFVIATIGPCRRQSYTHRRCPCHCLGVRLDREHLRQSFFHEVRLQWRLTTPRQGTDGSCGFSVSLEGITILQPIHGLMRGAGRRPNIPRGSRIEGRQDLDGGFLAYSSTHPQLDEMSR